MSLAAFQQIVDDLVRDTDQVITSPQRDSAIVAALARYSVDAPRVVIEDVTIAGDGTLPLPSSWDAALSHLRSAEWPIGQRPASIIPPSLIDVRATPAGRDIFLFVDLAPGATVRVTYTAAHALDPVDTLPDNHRRAVAALAASDLCGQLAAYYSNEGAPTIGADTVDHQGKSGRWRQRQRDLAADYTRLVAPAPTDRARPASADAVLPSRNALGGRRLFHPPGEWPRS